VKDRSEADLAELIRYFDADKEIHRKISDHIANFYRDGKLV
jgi:hypothetical protein